MRLVREGLGAPGDLGAGVALPPGDPFGDGGGHGDAGTTEGRDRDGAVGRPAGADLAVRGAADDRHARGDLAHPVEHRGRVVRDGAEHDDEFRLRARHGGPGSRCRGSSAVKAVRTAHGQPAPPGRTCTHAASTHTGRT
ncbi:hypothetical protein GCM10027610_036260 [Dactylosporangium cerinum]